MTLNCKDVTKECLASTNPNSTACRRKKYCEEADRANIYAKKLSSVKVGILPSGAVRCPSMCDKTNKHDAKTRAYCEHIRSQCTAKDDYKYY